MPARNARQRQYPPPTTHRLAAWLSLARGLAWAPSREIRFPPTEDDVSALQALWRQRLFQLREAGVRALQKRPAFEVALQCKPYALTYAGSGKVCRLPFCPFCHAADAAAGCERVRRAVERHGKDLGFVVNQVTARVDFEELAAPPDVVLENIRSYAIEPAKVFALLRGAPGSIVRYTAWPHDERPGKAVLAARILAAVPRERAAKVYDARRQYQRARAAFHGKGFCWQELGLGDDVLDTLHSGKYSVRSSPLSLARAVGHVYHYPAALLTAPPDATAAVLDGPAGQKMSSVRGVFRTALPVHPRSYPLQFVPTCRQGEGVVGEILSLLPEPEEALAAREVARTLGLPMANSLAEFSDTRGLRLFWLGKVEFSISDLARPKTTSPLSQAVALHRPAQPGTRHALVCATPGLGLAVFSTCPPAEEPYPVPKPKSEPQSKPVHPGPVILGILVAGRVHAVVLRVNLGRREYTLEPVRTFSRRLAGARGWVAR